MNKNMDLNLVVAKQNILISRNTKRFPIYIDPGNLKVN